MLCSSLSYEQYYWAEAQFAAECDWRSHQQMQKMTRACMHADGEHFEGATENASTENESTGGWNMQVRNT